MPACTGRQSRGSTSGPGIMQSIFAARSRHRRNGQPLPPLGERLRAMRLIPPFLNLVWQTHRGYAAAVIALRLLQAFAPLALLWVGKLIIDAVVASVGAGAPDWGLLALLVGLEAGIPVAREALPRSASPLRCP